MGAAERSACGQLLTPYLNSSTNTKVMRPTKTTKIVALITAPWILMPVESESCRTRSTARKPLVCAFPASRLVDYSMHARSKHCQCWSQCSWQVNMLWASIVLAILTSSW